MTYLQRFDASTSPDDPSGAAHFKIEGEDCVFPLPSFADAQRLDQMLFLAFRQGKDFAFNALKDHVTRSFMTADTIHNLTLSPVQAADVHRKTQGDA